MVTLRRALRWAATAMLASAGLVLLVALAVGPAQPGSPLFFKLQGLLAPPGLTPEV